MGVQKFPGITVRYEISRHVLCIMQRHKSVHDAQATTYEPFWQFLKADKVNIIWLKRFYFKCLDLYAQCDFDVQITHLRYKLFQNRIQCLTSQIWNAWSRLEINHRLASNIMNTISTALENSQKTFHLSLIKDFTSTYFFNMNSFVHCNMEICMQKVIIMFAFAFYPFFCLRNISLKRYILRTQQWISVVKAW